MAQHPVLKPDKDVPEFVTPKMGYYYVLDAGSNIARVNWTVSGGSFSLGSSQTSIPGGNFYGITVYWDNVKSTNGSTPQGKLTAEVYYSSGVSGEQSAPCTQKIKSLNGVTPPPLVSTAFSNLDYGIQNMTVKLDREFNYPGKNSDGKVNPVLLYEWTLPEGWKSGTQTGVFTTSSESINITTNNVGTGTVKVRGVNQGAEFDKSGYSSISFTRKFGFTAYPTSVPFGKTQTNTFTTQLVKGMTYEWSTPSGWKINNGGNTKEGLELNSVSITSSVCPTDGIVKVRLKKNGEVSQWYNCPYKGISDPAITSTAAYQFEYSTLALDVASSSLSKATWSGTGVYVASGQGTAAPKVIFTKSGSVTVQAVVSLSGCSGVRTISKTFTVSPFRYLISGESVICYNGNYTISNVTVPSEVQLTWSYTNGKLEIQGGQSTKTVSVGIAPGKFGDEWIRLTASLGGQSAAVSKAIYAGYPTVTKVTGPTSVRLNQGGSFIANPLYDNSVCEYKWTVSPSQGASQSPSRNTNYITFSIPGSYYIACRAYTTQCGAAGSAASTTVSVQSSYMVYSDGSSKIVDVIENQLENDESSILSDVVVSNQVSYQLYNQATGLLVAEGKMERSGGTLDFNQVNSGIYILRIQVSDAIFEVHRVAFK